MKPFRIRAEARRELRQAAGWYEAQQEGLGIDLLAKFEEKRRSLSFHRRARDPGEHSRDRIDDEVVLLIRVQRLERIVDRHRADESPAQPKLRSRAPAQPSLGT